MSKDPEAIEVGNTILREKGMMGIPQLSSKAGLIKCRYVIYVLRSVEGHIIDTCDSDYGHNWNIGLYDIVNPASTRKVEKSGSHIHKGRVVQGKVMHGYCPVLLVCLYQPPHPEQPHPDASAPHFGLRNEGLLVRHSQLRSHVEACCLPWTPHIGANRSEQKEMNTGIYPYFILNH